MAKVTSIRMSDDMIEKVDQLAAAVDRPRAWVLEQAVARYVQEEAWQIGAVREALADYQAGTAELVPHEDVVKRLDDKISAQLGDADPVA